MVIVRRIVAVWILLWLPFAAFAQSPVWIQVEALPSLAQAQDRVRDYASRLEDVAGFTTGGRWHPIVLGPYAPNDANILLQRLRTDRSIPDDSYIVDGRRFQQQFWPVGVGAPTTAQPLPGTTAVLVPSPTIDDQPVLTPQIADETLSEARRSEASLSRDDRELLQTALKWAGFYTSTIDGAYGPGTRRAMGAWQVANNFEATGVLTTAQRTALIDSYNAVLEGLDLQLVRDDATGIEILIPTGVVAFSAYDPPFARFDATGDVAAQVLLISQEGDRDRLSGLYEIMQTLAIVPVEGPRSHRDVSFELEGIGADVHSYTFARLESDEIKGFTLVWPAGDEARRKRVLEEMRASFRTTAGVLDPAIASANDRQAIDLLSGLQIRQPQISRSGFFIDARGDVLTSTDVINDCTRMTIDNSYLAEPVHIDLTRGIAVMRPLVPLAPPAVAAFQIGVPRLQTNVAVAGYPFGGVLTTPSLTFGTLADIRGLNGEDTIKRLSLTSQVGDVGGPILDNSGAVLGMLLPKDPAAGQQLPADVQFSVTATEIMASLDAQDISVQTTESIATLPAQAFTQRAVDMTVLVSCW